MSRPLREVLAVLFWLVLGAAWLLQQLVALVLAIVVQGIASYIRIRHGREAADDFRREAGESEEAGRAWRHRADARLARRVGWPSDSGGDGTQSRDRPR